MDSDRRINMGINCMISILMEKNVDKLNTKIRNGHVYKDKKTWKQEKVHGLVLLFEPHDGPAIIFFDFSPWRRQLIRVRPI